MESSKGAYVRDDDFPPNQHQVIHAHPCPVAPTARLLPAPDAQLRAQLPAPVEEQPDVVAFLDLAGAAGDVGAVVEDKGDEDLGGLDGLLHREEFLAQLFAGLGFAQQRGFGQSFGRDADVGIRSQPPFLQCGVIGMEQAWRCRSRWQAIWSAGSWCCRRRRGRFRVLLLFVLVLFPEGQFSPDGLLPFLLRRLRSRNTVL